MSKKKITKEEVEEVRHLVEKQEQAEELPYAVRNLNLPDLIELNEHKNFAREDLEDDLEDADYLASKQDAEEEDAWEAKRELAREDREDEEIDRLAREEVERSLYEDGIIEDPDCDGGLNG